MFINFKFKKLYLCLFTIGIIFIVQQASASIIPQAIQDAINKKAQELQQVLNQTKETQKQLDETQAQSKSLQTELKKIDQNIKQVDLSIKSSEITVEKLALEIDSLGYNIAESEQNITNQRELVAKAMQEIQKQGEDTSFSIFLRGQTLTDSIFDVQSLTELQAGLKKSINELTVEKNRLAKVQADRSTKKTQKEIEAYNLKNKKLILDDTREERNTLLATTKNKEKIYQEVMTALEKQQESIASEIDNLEKELRKSLSATELPTNRSGVLSCPLPSCVLTQDYGETSFARWAYKSGFHNGLDYKASIGTPIYAAADGTIMTTGNNGRVQYGKHIVIRHDNGLATLYAHLSKINVSGGDKVAKGEIIGYSGNTGYSTGPHLHFGVYWAPDITLKTISGAGLVPVGPTVNPKNYL